MRIVIAIFLCTILLTAGAFQEGVNANEHISDLQATHAWAGRITDENAARLVMGGPDAIGGVDDWFVTNGEICAIVSDLKHENELGTTGGVLVDLGFCQRNDDQFLYWHELLNLEMSGSFIAQEINAKTDGRSAQIIVKSHKKGVSSRTVYHMDTEIPSRLKITCEYYRTEENDQPIRGIANVVATLRGLKQFDLSTDGTVRSRGFVHHTREGGRSAFSQAASASDMMVYVGRGMPGRDIVYGQRVLSAHRITSEGKEYQLPRYFFSDDVSSNLAVFTDKYFFGNPRTLGLLKMLQIGFFDLRMNDRILIEQEILLARGSDVGLITDQIYAGEPVLQGNAGEPGAVVHIHRVDGSALTQLTAGQHGDFAAHVPPGDYQVQVRGYGGRSVTRQVSVAAGQNNTVELSLGPKAVITLPPGHVMRLTFTGEEDTPSPDFSDDLLGYALIDKKTGPRPAGEVHDINLGAVSSDLREIVLAPGKYRVYASRGPEYSLSVALLNAVAGETRSLVIEPPQRIIRTPGWIAADLHVHSGASLDTDLPLDERIISYLAQGGEVLVSTEHDNLYDYTPHIERLAVAGRLAYITGVEITGEFKSEITPYTIGHGNAFPLLPQPFAYRRGAPPHEGRRWHDVIAALKALPSNPLVQLNHARFTQEPGAIDASEEEKEVLEPQAFFTHMGSAGTPFDRHTSLNSGNNSVLATPDPATGTRDIDFDAMELLNGPYYASYHQLRDDWFSLLRQGERVTGTANSDSHRLVTTDLVLVPRNMVFVENDAVDAFQENRFIDAVREGRLYGTTGPLFAAVCLGEAGIGDICHAEEGTLSILVESAPWVNVDRVRVFDNGVRVFEGPIETGSALELPMRFERDSFVVIEVEGEAGEEYASILPGHIPFAFTNPIYVDADGDGEWTPIGAPLP